MSDKKDRLSESNLRGRLIFEMKTVSEELEAALPSNVTISGGAVTSYLLYLRAMDSFHAVAALISARLDVPAASELRPLSESFILLKASVGDPSFNSKFLKKTVSGKKQWVLSAREAHAKTGLNTTPERLSEISRELESMGEAQEKELQQIKQLFKIHGEEAMFIHVYQVGSHYLHPNLQSLKAYLNTSGTIAEFDQRGVSSRIAHTALSSMYVIVESCALACAKLNREFERYEHVICRLKELNDKIESID